MAVSTKGNKNSIKEIYGTWHNKRKLLKKNKYL